ncbi:MAG: MFS transporter [Limnobacter sp.]|nr:MFS transporter [Limnobacter sp.]
MASEIHEQPEEKQTRPLDLLNYGVLGWALGAVAVPIYIQVPYLYSRVFEVPSAWVGTILLVSRLIDALMDPLIGMWLDRRQGMRSRYTLPMVLSVPLMIVGMYGVFFPLGNTPTENAQSLMGSLFLVHLGFSLASISYQSWGAELGKTDREKSMFVAAREGIGIFGVVFAVSLALEIYADLIFSVFTAMLFLGMFLLFRLAPRPLPSASNSHRLTKSLRKALKGESKLERVVKGIGSPLKHSNFRRLMGVFMVNGLAAALPATLVPFYMRDRLGLSDSDQWVLAVYFLVGAMSTVFWVWLAGRIGLARAWLLAMMVSIPAFVAVIMLNQGDLIGYLMVCIVTGFALGADLSLPAALVARLIDKNGEKGTNEGSYFGLWNWINTCNLALAPSLALGVLDWFSYDPERTGSDEFMALPLIDQIAQDPLIWMYALVPIAMKTLAIISLALSGLTRMPKVTEEEVKQTPLPT